MSLTRCLQVAIMSAIEFDLRYCLMRPLSRILISSRWDSMLDRSLFDGQKPHLTGMHVAKELTP